MFRVLLTLLFFQSFLLLNADDEIGMEYINKDCVLGDDLGFAIIVSSAKQITEDFSEIKFNGKAIGFTKEVSVSSMFSSNNGKVYSQESYKTIYRFSFSPDKEGQITLPAMVFKINDKAHQTEPLNFVVSPIPISDSFNLFINIKGKRDYYYPSETIEVEVVFALKGYKEIVNYVPVMKDFNWLENQGLQYIPETTVNNKILINKREVSINWRNTSNTVPFDNYTAINAYTLMFKAISPGEYAVENCFAKGEVWTGRYLNSYVRDFSGNIVRQKQAVQLFTKCKPIKFTVKPLPDKNRPNDFAGAIGSFNIEVVSSSDTDLKVGDPVTLHINIIGDGAWDLVNSPALQKMPAITDFFRIGSDMPAGNISKENNILRKEFNVKLRVKSAAVKEIPALPFSYFDISKGQYVTKYSKPIPLKVFENSNKVEVETFNDKEDSKNKNTDLKIDKIDTGNLVVEAPLKPIEIMAIFKGDELSENHHVNYMLLYCSYLFLFFILLIVAILKIIKSGAVEKVQVNANIKSSNRKCLEKLSDLENKINEGNIVYKLIGDCLDDFFRKKFIGKNIYQGLNKESLAKLMQSDLIKTEVGTQLLMVFEKWENLKFSNADYQASQVLSLIKELKEVINKC